MNNFTKGLSEAEYKRLSRFNKMQKNRRGRKAPARVPAKLTRTSAFAPKRRGLITDSKFCRMYVVPKHSVVRVSGRELGTQHRDGMYGLFRVKQTKKLGNGGPKSAIGVPYPFEYEARTTWRELLGLMRVKIHVNNLLSLLSVFEDIKKVVITVYEGDPEEILKKEKNGLLAGSGGQMSSIINDIIWNGVDLDSEVVITYGSWAATMMQKAHLVSLNADVQFALKSDHAKSFWPYIDSQNSHTFIDEDMLAGLAGRNLWGENETSASRAQFRKDCRQAFNDMVKAKGLRGWHEEIKGYGRKKWRRYHYKHELERQMDLDLQEVLPLG